MALGFHFWSKDLLHPRGPDLGFKFDSLSAPEGSAEPGAPGPRTLTEDPSLGPVRLEGLSPNFGEQRRWPASAGPSSQSQLHSRAPTVSVSPRSMAELMAGASLLALRSISSMTPCTSGPDRLWNSIVAGPGTRLPRGRACPPPQLPGAPGVNRPGASPPRPRPRPSSAAPPGQAPGPGPPRARTPPAEAWGQLHRGAPGRRRRSQGHKGRG